MYFDTFSILLSTYSSPSSIPPIAEYIVAGNSTPGDGGGGTFVWISVTSVSQLLPSDGGIIFRTPPNSGGVNSGYFKRIYSGPVNVRWFGAKGDGVTDDTAAVHAAAKAAQYGT